MSKSNRGPILNETQQRDVLTLLMLGSSRRNAARYAGCTVAAIDRTTRRDEEFASRLRKAEHRLEADCLKSLHQAVTREQQWRAATWLLERLNPEEFAKRNPRSISANDFVRLCTTLSEVITNHVPERYRSVVLKELDRMIAGLETDSVPKDEEDET